MKKYLLFFLAITLVFALVIGCASKPAPKPAQPQASKPPAPAQPLVKRPDILDHKNYKWGREPPEWVTMNVDELQKLDKYKDVYVFKFESPRAKDLQGAELWTKNFTAAAEIAQQIRNRVQVKFAGAAAGDMNKLEGYMEQVVKSFSDTTVVGYKQVDSYWVQMRYYKPDGNVEEDAYTYLALYTIPKTVLDEQIRKALDEAAVANKPRSPDEETARKRVKDAFAKEGL
ncbi:MAG: hypothetical protein N2442_03715 [Spirochaetes bacterium]|nr:hypothetical protein [Spirochaetota bacterium]